MYIPVWRSPIVFPARRRAMEFRLIRSTKKLRMVLAPLMAIVLTLCPAAMYAQQPVPQLTPIAPASNTLAAANPGLGDKLLLLAPATKQLQSIDQAPVLITPALADSLQKKRHWTTYAAWGGLIGAALYGGVGLHSDLTCPPDDMFCGTYTLVQAVVGGTVGFVGGLLVHLGMRD
jgi:hypothetical protein